MGYGVGAKPGGPLLPLLLAALCFASGQPVAAQASDSLYASACESGRWDACNVLGLMLETGEGVPPNAARAVTLYERACTAGGLAVACTNLGRMFARGVGIEPDSVRARELYEVACEAGEELACSLREAQPLPRSGEADPSTTPDGGRLVGRVIDPATGEGLPNVSIRSGDGSGGLSGDDGRFVIGDVPAGSADVTFQRIGYDARSVIVDVEPGRTVELEVSMSTRPIELAPIEVTVRPVLLEHNGFYARRDMGLGTQLTGSELDELRLRTTSRLFSRIAGVSARRYGPGGMFAVSPRGVGMSGQECILEVFVDGQRTRRPFDLDLIPIEQIEAIEVYHGATTPIQYLDECGAVLIWTG